MEVTRELKRKLRVQNTIFYTLFSLLIGVLAFLSVRYEVTTDVTLNRRNTPTENSLALLKTIDKPVVITAFVTSGNDAVRREVARLAGLFQRANNQIKLKYVNPETEPGLVRELGVTVDGELIVTFGGRTEHIQDLNEQALSNALQRLVRGGQRWLAFTEGHGERQPHGATPQDYTQWVQQLENRGIKTRTINLVSDKHIPKDTTAVVIAAPKRKFLPGEVTQLRAYLEQGGNLLWLSEPGPSRGLEPIAEQLGVELLPGTLVDPQHDYVGFKDPRFIVVSDYVFHPITQQFAFDTIFPEARGLEANDNSDWEHEIFLESLPRVWAKTGDLGVELAFDKGEDVPGPLALGIAFSRNSAITGTTTDTEEDTNEQRVVVVGDSDFVSDMYLGQGGNLDLGLNIVNWLGRDELLMAVPTKNNVDRTLDLSVTMVRGLTLLLLGIVPIALLAAGGRIWWIRRQR
ncbi:MAG: GldG family protein [Gammaproteobacteria bacterium]|nr:GldG family protein [Gammaproteobacteria bacterium]